MKHSIKKKWIAALRSGDYTQCKGKLRSKNEFCCLGVLCNLHAQAHPEFAATQKDPNSYDDERVLPSDRILIWAGIHDESLIINGITADIVTHLWERNDGLSTFGKHNFNDIADFIEKHL